MNPLTTLPSRPPFEPGLYVTLFADASYCPDTQAYGWCWWLKYGNPAKTEVGVGGGMWVQGSNQAEIEALRAGIAFVAENLGAGLKGKRVVVQSDCTGALEVIKPELQGLRQLGAAAAYTKHVKGHQGHKTARNSVNTLCDRLAKQEMKTRRYQAQQGSTGTKLRLRP